MQRYFAKVNEDKVILTDEDLHHITRVMRMRVGDEFEVVDNGNLYVFEITSFTPFNAKLIETKEEDVELNKPVTLFFALAKGDKIDLVIQKATELGASKIVLFRSKRCVVDFANKDIEKKLLRFNKIAKEASEQCHRLVIPEVIGVVDLKDIKNYLEDVNFLAYEKEAEKTTALFSIYGNMKSVSVMIGSEGGFDEEEVNYLNSIGFMNISLGKRILRCETAAIYALSVIAYQLEK